MPPTSRIISQVLSLTASPSLPALKHVRAELKRMGVGESYFGRDDERKPGVLFCVLQWPSELYKTHHSNSTLLSLLSELDTKKADPEVVATVAFDDPAEARKALTAPLVQLCTVELKTSVDRKTVESPLLRTFTDCYEAPGFTGGSWGPDENVEGGRLNWYYLGWENKKVHDDYMATPLFWVEINNLKPHMSGGWTYFITMEKDL